MNKSLKVLIVTLAVGSISTVAVYIFEAFGIKLASNIAFGVSGFALGFIVVAYLLTIASGIGLIAEEYYWHGTKTRFPFQLGVLGSLIGIFIFLATVVGVLFVPGQESRSHARVEVSSVEHDDWAKHVKLAREMYVSGQYDSCLSEIERLPASLQSTDIATLLDYCRQGQELKRRHQNGELKEEKTAQPPPPPAGE
ncbi:MAG: hypothetical protein AB7F86_15130 [Bdellovibrionales bacterium]